MKASNNAAEATIDENGEDLCIEGMEALLVAKPEDLDLKKDLAYALLDRYLGFAVDRNGGDKKDLKRLRALIKEIPEPKATLPRAYVAYVDKKFDKAIDWLAVWATDYALDPGLLECDQLIDVCYLPFSSAKPEFWMAFYEVLNKQFPDSAAAYFIRALADKKQDVDSAAGYFKLALDQDKTFWAAAQELADIYFGEKIWEQAAFYYAQALEIASAQYMPVIHDNYAWCLGKLGRHQEEEKHFRECLNLDPDFDCMNELGCSIRDQGRYEEALSVFDEAIKNGVGGIFPRRNRARALTKLKRFSHAIEAWKAVSQGRPISQYDQKAIDRLEKFIVLEAKGQEVPSEELAMATEPAEDEEGNGTGDDLQDTDSQRIRPAKGKPVNREALLEQSIYRQIQRGDIVFGRKLKLYGRGQQIPAGKNGRIDLLAEDENSGELVVIELKRDEGDDKVVGQISRYMSWVREEIAQRDRHQNVIGVICVFEASPNLKLSAKSVPGLELFVYGTNIERA